MIIVLLFQGWKASQKALLCRKKGKAVLFMQQLLLLYSCMLSAYECNPCNTSTLPPTSYLVIEFLHSFLTLRINFVASRHPPFLSLKSSSSSTSSSLSDLSSFSPTSSLPAASSVPVPQFPPPLVLNYKFSSSMLVVFS